MHAIRLGQRRRPRTAYRKAGPVRARFPHLGLVVSEPEARIEATVVVASMSEMAPMRGAERLF